MDAMRGVAMNAGMICFACAVGRMRSQVRRSVKKLYHCCGCNDCKQWQERNAHVAPEHIGAKR